MENGAPGARAPRGNALVRWSIEHPVTMGMILLGVLVLGWVSLGRLPLEYLPAFSSSNISVQAPYPSSSPAEVERLLVRPLEESLGTINGIDTLSATASADAATLNVSFVDGTDMELAAVEVRDRIDRVRHMLPDDLQRIGIRRFQSSDIPVLRFDVSAAWPEERLYEYVETVLQRRLERLEGVAQVSVSGLRIPELQVELDPGRLRSHGVDVRRLLALLRSSNLTLSAGELQEGNRELLVRVVGQFGSADEVRRLPLGVGDLRLGDVAEVRLGYPEQEEFNFLNGVEALTVSVNKTSTSNLLAVVERVKAELGRLEAGADGLTVRIYSDASIDVLRGLGQLRDAGLVGAALAILCVYLFLRRLRTTALIALAIPVSVVATFVLLFFLRQSGAIDVTLNVISLAGLMLALGMLVDNSIVVIESIFRHRNELAADAGSAALHGTSEVALPIVASTATTICVFAPLIFLGGGRRFKLYFENVGITICIVMVASLLVALTVVPLVAKTILRGQRARPATDLSRIHAAYARLLRATLRHRLVFMALMLVLFGGTIWLFGTIEQSLGGGGLEREVVIKVDTPRQYSLGQTAALYEEIHAILDARREELDIADIAWAYDRGSGRSRGGWGRERQISVFLKDEAESRLLIPEAQERIRALLPQKAGAELRIAAGRGRHGSTGLEVELSGEDPVVLELLARRIVERLGRLPEVRDVDTSLESGDDEIRVGVQRDRALAAGLSTSAVATTVRGALSSRGVSTFLTADRELDLVVQYREEDRATLDQLRNLTLFAGATPLPLDALAEFEIVAGPRSIERENHAAKISVTANVRDARAMVPAMRATQELLEETALPPGYGWTFGRWNRYARQDQESGLFALLFALPLVYMLLAALFESFSQPLSIMFSVPFALIGVAAAMKLAGQPWDSFAMMGLIVLMGVVVNNAIVLIDHVNRLRRGGMTRDEAILLGGKARLRPIVMTAATTILGMLPMLAPLLFPQWVGPVEGRAASWIPLGLVIVGGLCTSTFLTLVILPTVYSLIDDATRFVRRVARAA